MNGRRGLEKAFAYNEVRATLQQGHRWIDKLGPKMQLVRS